MKKEIWEGRVWRRMLLQEFYRHNFIVEFIVAVVFSRGHVSLKLAMSISPSVGWRFSGVFCTTILAQMRGYWLVFLGSGPGGTNDL